MAIFLLLRISLYAYMLLQTETNVRHAVLSALCCSPATFDVSCIRGLPHHGGLFSQALPNESNQP
jgi:hypothetical protein